MYKSKFKRGDRVVGLGELSLVSGNVIHISQPGVSPLNVLVNLDDREGFPIPSVYYRESDLVLANSFAVAEAVSRKSTNDQSKETEV